MIILNLLLWQLLKGSNFIDVNRDLEEKFWSYVVTLKELAATCIFGSFLHEALRDRLVCGLRSEAMQWCLLSKKGLTWKTAQEIAQAMEMANQEAPSFGSTVYSVAYPKYMVTVGINGKPLQMEIDSGSVVWIVNEVTYKELIQDRPLQHFTLRDYNQAKVPLLGIVSVSVEYNGECKILPLVVSWGNRPNLICKIGWLNQVELEWGC